MSSFPAEPIAHIGSFAITNTLLHTFIVDGILVGTSIYIAKHTKLIPRGFQNIVEAVIEPLYNLTESIAQSRTKYIFPYFCSFFLFIVVANLTGLLPGFGSFGIKHKEPVHAETTTVNDQTHETSTAINETEHGETPKDSHENQPAVAAPEEKHEGKPTEQHAAFIPLLRGATSDINVTLALALISVIATHMLSIKLTGIKDYLGRFFSLNPVYLFVGILEIAAEITKIVSLTFRLFGNIFAGEVALATISKLFAFVLPLPFIFLEMIVGVVQALVFSILTLVFMSILTTSHHAEEGAHH